MVRISLFLACLAISASVQAADLAAGQAAYAVCAACHGPAGQGNQAMNAPQIAGQAAWYTKRQLTAYQKGHRGTAAGDTYGAQMRPMSMTVTAPAAMDNIAAYIESLPASKPAATVGGDAAAGAAAYAVCAACHGQQAEGNDALGGPALANLNDWYLARQLKNFKEGRRAYHPEDTYGAQMKPMSMTLADDTAINNVAAYIGTLAAE
ncbi:MAG: c-type cytochrome [Pseudomonadota bacterium]